MSQIIRKMQYDVHPPTQSKTKVLSMSHRYHLKASLIAVGFIFIFSILCYIFTCVFLLVLYQGNLYWSN